MLRMSRPALATWPSALCRPRCRSQLAAQRNRRSLWPPRIAADGDGAGDVEGDVEGDVDGVGAEAGAWPAAAETQKERHRMVLLYCECDYLKDMQ